MSCLIEMIVDSSLLETDLVAVAQRLLGAKEMIVQDNDKENINREFRYSILANTNI
jgi:hypothetical protein